eukprot:4228175-Prymnesium_polylepis.2
MYSCVSPEACLPSRATVRIAIGTSTSVGAASLDNLPSSGSVETTGTSYLRPAVLQARPSIVRPVFDELYGRTPMRHTFHAGGFTG